MANQTDARTFSDAPTTSLTPRIATLIRLALQEMSRLLQFRSDQKKDAKTDYFESAFHIERYREEARQKVDRLLY